jgi:hypothetical protein
MRMRRYCPNCDELVYEEMFIEGEIDLPSPTCQFPCPRCGWKGQFCTLRTLDHDNWPWSDPQSSLSGQ